MANYTTLRAASIARQVEWFAGGPPSVSLSFRANELAGEAGEVAALLLDRLEYGHTVDLGVWVANMGEELADVVISADLVAMDMGLTLLYPADTKLGTSAGPTYQELCTRLWKETGAVSNLVKKIDRERLGLPGSRATHEDVHAHLQAAVDVTYALAHRYAIDLHQAVCDKFNNTSAKVGLTTRLIYAAE